MDFLGTLITLISIGAFAFFGYRLYLTLGRREGHMEPPPARKPAADPAIEAAPAGPAVAAGPAASGLEAIADADPRFDAAGFLEGARTAYRMVVSAFADGDKDALRPLLAASVFDRYVDAIDGRRARGETLKTEIDRLSGAEIVDAVMEAGSARIKVAFTADIATETRDREGVRIAGNIDQLSTVKEAWTFERRADSGDPNWALAGVATL